MSSRKRKSKNKKKKNGVIVEKQVPDFEAIQDTLLDSYSLIRVAYKILEAGDEDDDHGHATGVLRHGETLLKQALEQFEDANMRLGRYCRQNNIAQEGA
jgi:hypothetical protein